MEYRPRYSQPFTLREAAQMDVPVITEEIARLQDSLQRLQQTQEELRKAVDSDPDPEFAKAIEENELVIGSQGERISILKMALTEKGIQMGPHYATNMNNTATVTPEQSAPVGLSEHRSFNGSSFNAHPPDSDDEDGIHL